MQLITVQRVNDEKLEWKDVRVELDSPHVIDGEIYTYARQSQIIDAKGNTYYGVIQEDGTVEASGGYTRYDSVATFEGFGKSGANLLWTK